MVFCGNCGFRLALSDRQCPRCGTAIDPDLLATEEDAQPDAPTAASPSLLGRMQPPPQATRPPGSPAGDQQRLILRPGQDAGNYGMQDASEATRRVDASGYDPGTATQRAPSNPDMRTSYPGYPQAGNNYPPQQTPYPGYPQGSMNDYAPPTQFAPQENMGYQAYPGQYPQRASQAKGRTAALVIILLGLLLILLAMTLFILQRNGVIGASSNGGSTATVTTTSATPEQQAQAFIQQYYDNVNKKDYPAAYNMWNPQKQTLANFESGYSNTIHDSVTFDNVAAQSDGTVKVPVTVTATEKTAAGGATDSTYKGYYIVEQQNNGWKIRQGVLNKV